MTSGRDVLVPCFPKGLHSEPPGAKSWILLILDCVKLKYTDVLGSRDPEILDVKSLCAVKVSGDQKIGPLRSHFFRRAAFASRPDFGVHPFGVAGSVSESFLLHGGFLWCPWLKH